MIKVVGDFLFLLGDWFHWTVDRLLTDEAATGPHWKASDCFCLSQPRYNRIGGSPATVPLLASVWVSLFSTDQLQYSSARQQPLHHLGSKCACICLYVSVYQYTLILLQGNCNQPNPHKLIIRGRTELLARELAPLLSSSCVASNCCSCITDMDAVQPVQDCCCC